MFESLHDLVNDSSWTYLALFAIAALDAVFPLVPSETAVITAGVLASSGGLELWLVILSAAAGAWLGDNTSYLIGNRIGTPVAHRFFAGERARHRLEWARGQLDERGAIVILLARFIPGGRTAVTFTAGLVRYPWKERFLPFSIIAGSVWAAYAALLGYLGGKIFEEKPLYGLLLAFGIAGTIAIGYEAIRRWRAAD